MCVGRVGGVSTSLCPSVLKNRYFLLRAYVVCLKSGHLPTLRLWSRSPALVTMSKCPWARCWTFRCSWYCVINRWMRRLPKQKFKTFLSETFLSSIENFQTGKKMHGQISLGKSKQFSNLNNIPRQEPMNWRCVVAEQLGFIKRCLIRLSGLAVLLVCRYCGIYFCLDSKKFYLAPWELIRPA